MHNKRIEKHAYVKEDSLYACTYAKMHKKIKKMKMNKKTCIRAWQKKYIYI